MPYINGISPQFDPVTRKETVISVAHAEAHEGHSFVATVVADGTSLVMAFKTNNSTKVSHSFITFISESKAHIELIEGLSWDSGSGAQSAIYNRNRNSSESSTLLEDTTGSFSVSGNVIKGPTNLAGGTVVWTEYTWVDKKQGEKAREDEEFILKTNTTYAIRLTSDDGVKGLQIIMRWYEHFYS